MSKKAKKIVLSFLVFAFFACICSFFLVLPKPVNALKGQTSNSPSTDGSINVSLGGTFTDGLLEDSNAGNNDVGAKEWISGWISGIDVKFTHTLKNPIMKLTVRKTGKNDRFDSAHAEFGTGKVQVYVYENSTLIFSSEEKSKITVNNGASEAINYTLGNALEFGKKYKVDVRVRYAGVDGLFGAYWATGGVRFQTKTYTISESTSNFSMPTPVHIDDNYYYYNKETAINFTDSNTTSTVSGTTITVRPERVATLDDEAYTSGTLIDETSSAKKFTLYMGRNYEQYYVVVDKTAPVINVFDKANNNVNNGYFSENITVKIDELNKISKTTITGDDGAVILETYEKTITLSPTEFDNFSTLTIDSKDACGNKAVSVKMTVWKNGDFENEHRIENSYKTTSWYNVRLPKTRYTDIMVWDYSFKTYAEALEFAVEMERTYKVEETAYGWVYSTADNYANSQEYVDESVLNIVIDKWAKTYISSKQTYATTGNDYYAEKKPLSENDVALPSEISSSVGELNCYLIPHDFVFEQDVGRVEQGITQTVDVEYLGDEVNGNIVYESTNVSAQLIINSATFSENLTAIGADYQGFWLITERDSIYNERQYVVYYDRSAPVITLTGTLGDGSAREIEIGNYDGTRYFMSLTFGDVADNREKDEHIQIIINGRGYNNVVFNSFDEIEELKWENGNYGEYVIGVFDRSNNVNEYTFVIAPETEAIMSHTSLTNETRLKLTFSPNYKYNSITSLEIYKILSDGTKQIITADDDGLTINNLSLEYVFYSGGKYQAKMIDIFGRTTWSKTIFYRKGLPTATLDGVVDGGTTRRNVSLTTALNNVVRLYIIDTGTRVLADGSIYTEQIDGYEKIVSILANDGTSHKYLIAVHNNLNEELFVEYTFEIDTICADVIIYDLNGNAVNYDSAVNTGFYIVAIDSGTKLTYYVNENNSGLNTHYYTLGDRITADSTYYFTITDKIGNTKTFSILVDTVVRYSVGGNYVLKDGKLVATEPITLTVMETTETFILSDGANNLQNGAVLSADGLYNLFAVDNYGNVLNLTVQIDSVAPVIELTGCQNGAFTKNAVLVEFEDGATGYLTNSKGGAIADLSSGTIFETDGAYYVSVYDYAGNVSTVSFFIQTKIEITSNVVNNQITTKPVRVSFDTDVSFTVLKNGEEINSVAEYKDVGAYVITATDELGNELIFTFRIIDSLYREYELEIPSGWSVSAIYKNENLYETETLTFNETGVYVITLTDGESFYELIIEIDREPPTIEIDVSSNQATIKNASKDNLSATLYKDGVQINYTLGNKIEESGQYRLEIVDELGNKNVYEFEVPFRLDGFAIAAIIVGCVVVCAIAIVIIVKTKKIKI